MKAPGMEDKIEPTTRYPCLHKWETELVIKCILILQSLKWIRTTLHYASLENGVKVSASKAAHQHYRKYKYMYYNVFGEDDLVY